MNMMEESIEQLKELRVIEHMQTIAEYVAQIPFLRVPASTLNGVVNQMMKEYNEKYFPETAEAEKGKEKKG
jgi:hypothetical protein